MDANLQTMKSGCSAYVMSYTTGNVLYGWHQETHGPK